MEVTKAVAVMALQALRLLIELAHGRGYEGSQRECGEYGGRMKFENYRGRRVLSSFGSLSYERAYYYYSHCHRGAVSLDERLALGGRSVTPRVQLLIGFFGGHLSFGVVKKALW